MPCNDPNCSCQQDNRQNKISNASGQLSNKPTTAINVAHDAMSDAVGLANRVRNLVDAILGSSGQGEVASAKDAPMPGGVLPSLADHAIGTATAVAVAQQALDRLEAQTL